MNNQNKDLCMTRTLWASNGMPKECTRGEERITVRRRISQLRDFLVLPKPIRPRGPLTVTPREPLLAQGCGGI